MRLKPDRLPRHLQQKGLAPIYLVGGDEPLQRLEAEDAIRSFARDSGFAERVVLDVGAGFDWDSIRQAASNLSLFSNKQLIELRLAAQKPGREGGRALVEYAEKPSEDTVLLISTEKIDKKTQQTKWCKTLEKNGVFIQTWPVGLAQLPGWISDRFHRRGKTIDREAVNLITQRVEGNLLAAKQEIDKLCLLIDDKHIDVEQVINAVAENARYDVFSLIENAFSGRAERALRMLKGLQSEGVEPAALHGAILWEFRRACSMAYKIRTGASMDSVFASFYVWEKRRPAFVRLLERHSAAQLQALLNKTIQIERLIKSSTKVNIWDEFGWLLLSVAATNNRIW